MYSYPLLYFKQIVKALGYVPSGMKTVLRNSVVNQTAAYTDVTGLSFPVKAGTTYTFTFFIIYDLLDALNGSAWSINGPAITSLAYMSKYSSDTPSGSANYFGLSAYNLPASTTTKTASTTANIATIQGVIKPSASGTVIARFMSEQANHNLTAKAGSYVEYMEL